MDKILNIERPLEIKILSPEMPFIIQENVEDANPPTFRVNILVQNNNATCVKSEISSFGEMYFQWGTSYQSL